MSTSEPKKTSLPEGLAQRSEASRRWLRIRERGITAMLGSAALFSVLTTAAIIAILAVNSARFFGVEGVTIREFLFSTEWSLESEHYGVWPLICGTLLVTVVAMAVALPLGLVTAIFLSEYAPSRLRAVLKPLLEILAGIPTVVYGFFALTFITPHILQAFDPTFDVFNACSAGLAVGVLCLPIVTSLTEDALRAVPKSLRDAGYGLGATRFEVSLKIVVPAALSGIISAFLLAVARAVGETMVVALAAGSQPQMTLDVRDQVETITGYMVRISGGDIEHSEVVLYSLYAVAATLFVMTFALTVLGQMIRKRYQEVYR
jgi:phosphate transport system permease protein